MFFVIPEIPTKTFVMLKKLPGHFKTVWACVRPEPPGDEGNAELAAPPRQGHHAKPGVGTPALYIPFLELVWDVYVGCFCIGIASV